MDIFAQAIQMEKDGEAYYRQLAHRTGNKGLTAILTMLADEEVKHQKIITNMQTSAVSVQASGVLTRAKNIFTEIRDADEPLPDDTSQAELYKHALTLERQSEDFYAAQADKAADHEAAVFKALAAEERKHAILLEHVIEFVSRPRTWLEDAEFYHLEAY
jgi:rubrerythrin